MNCLFELNSAEGTAVEFRNSKRPIIPQLKTSDLSRIYDIQWRRCSRHAELWLEAGAQAVLADKFAGCWGGSCPAPADACHHGCI
jgi:hypothetical protein